jgi:hypothetical protein
VLLVLVIGWVLFRAVFLPHPATPQQRVDYAQVVPPARKAARFDLVAPAGLPAGWRATSVRFTSGVRQHWHLGVLTGRSRYVGLEQGQQPVPEMVAAYVDPNASRGAKVVVAGQTWSTYTDSGGDLALVRHAGTTTTLVVGHDLPRSQLRAYVARLR